MFRFERNELDLGRYELRRAGRRLPLSRIPMEFLILLLERPGNLVTREDIASHLWPEPGSVDIVQGINTAVNRIRAVLNDDASKPRFVETVVGKGYRFIADVEEIKAAPPLPALPPVIQNEPERSPEQPVAREAPRARGTWVKWIGVSLLLAGAGLAAWYWKNRPIAGNEPVFRQVTTLVPENRATAAAISPEGRLVAYANIDGIFVRAKNGETTALRAPGDFVVDRLAWFANGTKSNT